MSTRDRIVAALRNLYHGAEVPEEISPELLADLRELLAESRQAHRRTLPFTVRRLRDKYFDP